jgi:hypothetical protein
MPMSRFDVRRDNRDVRGERVLDFRRGLFVLGVGEKDIPVDYAELDARRTGDRS